MALDEAHFRAVYDGDAANTARQDWGKYREWVRKFYEGTRLPPVKGWNAQMESLLARLSPEPRASLASRLERLGRAIAGEWAKENAIRRIGTADLQGWGRDLERAARSDPGDGSALEPVLAAAEKDVESRLG